MSVAARDRSGMVTAKEPEAPPHLLMVDPFQFATIQLILHSIQLVLQFGIRVVNLGDLLVQRMTLGIRRHASDSTPR